MIGANVVNLTQDMTMSQMRTDNILGRITGEAFCGGIVGYQRTYAASQLGTAELKNVALEILPGLDSNGVPAYPRNTLANPCRAVCRRNRGLLRERQPSAS